MRIIKLPLLIILLFIGCSTELIPPNTKTRIEAEYSVLNGIRAVVTHEREFQDLSPSERKFYLEKIVELRKLFDKLRVYEFS